MEEKPRPSWRKARLAKKKRLQRLFSTDSEEMDSTDDYLTDDEMNDYEDCEALE